MISNLISNLMAIAQHHSITINYTSNEGCKGFFDPGYTVSMDKGEINYLAKELDVPYNRVCAVILSHEIGHCLAMIEGKNGYDEWIAWEYAEKIHPNTKLWLGLRKYALDSYIEEYGSERNAHAAFAMDYAFLK